MSRCVLWPTRWRHQADEVGGAAGQLEADDVRAEQALEDLAAPRQLLEQLGRRERDVQEEADAQVGPQLAEHLRDQLQLVVLHPDRGALGGHLGGLGGEPLVDPDVGVPPLAVEGRLGDHVVVERPERAVGEALVELLDLSALSETGTSEIRPRRTARPPRRCRPASRSRRRRSAASPAPGRSPGHPGTCASRVVPSASVTRSTGSRLATITRSAEPVEVTPATLCLAVRPAAHPCGRASGPPPQPGLSVRPSPDAGGGGAGPRAPRAPRRPPPRGRSEPRGRFSAHVSRRE